MLPIVEGGARTKITKHEALLRKLFADALKGDRKAQAEVLKTRQRFTRTPQVNPEEDDSEAETFVMFGSPTDRAGMDEAPPDRRRSRGLSIKQRKQESRQQTFDRIAARPITVRENGAPRKMAFEEALWHSLYADALKGDHKARALIVRFIDTIGSSDFKRPPSDVDKGETIFTLNIGDKKVITGDEPDLDPAESEQDY